MFGAGAQYLLLKGTKQMSWFQAGPKHFPSSPVVFLTQQNSATPVYQTLRQYVPKAALWFTLSCEFYRGVADTNGNTDVTGLIRLPGYSGLIPGETPENFAIMASAWLSRATPNPVLAGELVESPGRYVDVPNLRYGADWASFYWLCQGNTIDSAMMTLALAGFTMPDDRPIDYASLASAV